ncbi:ORC-CDC6 family AAA ATPase [Dongia sedimenti]|uniref:AAA+ ATPase domain-containing protein n=1 Tax=Dongia sedimenti TaxID=3064282 RepID=A0ABU0YUP4_9PROT|nr:hypothetical protein [Rhodospirillaceae bacterium R-7]
MSYELEYNARSVPPAEVAASFVPPEPHFSRLLARGHTLLVGPRGSGKTTLLKMLTVKALRNWRHAEAKVFSRAIKYNAAFVQADIAWSKQIESLDALSFDPRRKEAAFVLHSLRALIHAMREAIDLGRSESPGHIAHLGARLDAHQEENLVEIISNGLGVTPVITSMLGVEVSLEAKLNDINSGQPDSSYSVESFPSKVSLAIAAFNGITGDDDRRWALLFDELEIAPKRIKSFLLSGLRSFDQRVIVKLAMAPYMEDAGFEKTATSPHPLHDYNTISLTYANKDEASKFSAALFASAFERFGFQVNDWSKIFQTPSSSNFGRNRRIRKRDGLPLEFLSLARKDSSFARFVQDRNLLSSNYKFSDENNAQDIRKVLPIVIARDYYLRKFEGTRVVAERSRKSQELYAGFPSIMEITEGNPRAILTLIGPLARNYRMAIETDDRMSPISVAEQSSAISRVELLLTSLLQVIPFDIPGFNQQKGLLDFVDKIGRAFEDRLLRRPFSTDYLSTFVLDSNLTPTVMTAFGRALNAGAFIHVPNKDGGSDSLLRGFLGQRFRLSYALAPRYRLLLTLGDRINLSRLLIESQGIDISIQQPMLFREEGGDDHK